MADTNTKYSFLDYEGLALFWNNVKNVIEDNELITTSALTNLNTRVDTVENALANQIISITYTDLKTLRDAGNLVPGQQYRITDYTCTTTTAGTRSAGNQFDIIVTADSKSVLNEEARAIQHEGDSYFSGCDLNAWKIWYCLDNDTTRFKWADTTNGKGVIYRMIDEWNNDIPYDFKNIQFKHPNDTTTYPYYYYTFASSNEENNTDYSLSITNNCYSNTISEYIDDIDNSKISLNCIIFIGNNCYNNSFDTNCYNNYFGSYSHDNSFKSECYSNSFGDGCYSNTFGKRCFANTFGGEFNANTFGDQCYSNSFEFDCGNNTFGDNCYSNSFGFDFYCNTFGNECFSNCFGESCYRNNFGNICLCNYFGESCHNNSFGNGCCYIKFASDISEPSTKYNYYQNNHFGDGCQYILFKGAETASDSSQVQNYNFAQGTCGTEKEYLTIDGKRNRSYETYISKDTDGNIKESIIAEKLDKLIEISYSELVALRDSSKLVPGQQYRITDYTCTTTTAGTTSAGHVFDIIVTADDENTLNEVARAIQHEGDSYFANSDLNAWKIWYCLDNDTSRFDWADETNGKGVIYRMIDEFNNDVPYDFKNIQFYRQWDPGKSLWSTISSDNTGVPCYTFSSRGDKSTTAFTDASLVVSNAVYSNVIKEYIKTLISSSKQTLNNNCFFGNNCCGNTFGQRCYNNSVEYYCQSNTFGDNCYNNTFRNKCSNNFFGNACRYNIFGINCHNNTFGFYCTNNHVGDNCSYNFFRNYCTLNTFYANCISNSFGDNCNNNSFINYCSYNSFGENCNYNSLGEDCRYNSFGNGCSYNSFTVYASSTSILKDYVHYNHFDDGCSYNVIWNSDTTSSSVLLKNININRGVVGTSSSYNMINIDVLNSEQEINVNMVNGSILVSKLISNIVSITYESLKTLRDSSKLIPGQQYRIIDYITRTSQENTRSIGHQFDIIVTALNESTLSEEAQAIQNSNDGYFDGSNLSAWKIWYCLDNDTSRFAWAGDEKIDEITYTSYNSSQCTIKPELIDGNAFITPFNFESCVWVDGNNDGVAYSDDRINHDISELIYEWGYFTDENGVKQLCIYKSDAGYYEEEGRPDYGDKYLYRGVVNVDGTEYDYWQKWDINSENGGLNINGGDDYVFATTQRIVSNPEAYSVTTVTEDIYEPGKGVIYRMIDEWNNDVPYDFKNIQFNGDWGYWAYTFNWVNDNSDNTCEDLSVAQYAHTNDEGGYSHTYGNIIKPCEDGSTVEYGYPLKLNNIVFLNTESYDGGYFYGCYSNTFGNDCYSNYLGNNCYNNVFGNYCCINTFGNRCSSNSFGNRCSGNTFSYNCYSNTFGDHCSNNSFEYYFYNNTFGNECEFNSFDSDCYGNSLENFCKHNTFGNWCCRNSFGNGCNYNSFGNNCYNNSFGNACSYNSFRVGASSTLALKDYVYYNHLDDGCSYNVIWNSDTTSSSVLLKNINVNRGVVGTSSSYNMININTLNQDYEIQVAKNSKSEIKVYCEADLIA